MHRPSSLHGLFPRPPLPLLSIRQALSPSPADPSCGISGPGILSCWPRQQPTGAVPCPPKPTANTNAGKPGVLSTASPIAGCLGDQHAALLGEASSPPCPSPPPLRVPLLPAAVRAVASRKSTLFRQAETSACTATPIVPPPLSLSLSLCLCLSVSLSLCLCLSVSLSLSLSSPLSPSLLPLLVAQADSAMVISALVVVVVGCGVGGGGGRSAPPAALAVTAPPLSCPLLLLGPPHAVSLTKEFGGRGHCRATVPQGGGKEHLRDRLLHAPQHRPRLRCLLPRPPLDRLLQARPCGAASVRPRGLRRGRRPRDLMDAGATPGGGVVREGEGLGLRSPAAPLSVWCKQCCR